ncbi:MAG: NUDIX hydrolase N-terminal domain-containing protein [Chitinophagales bacterium]|nr:NUDIX hydrolase N-terminal domain-containing protein [Chitinophagales bacterium]
MKSNDFLAFLENLSAISRNGLFYTKNSYDKDRYQKVLDLVELAYTQVGDIEKHASNQFKKIDFITPKVGVNIAIMEEDNILIAKRKDDGLWELPGGWAEIGETAIDCIQREILEELNLRVNVLKVVDVFCRLPKSSEEYVTSYHILYCGEIIDGNFQESSETSEIKWIKKEDVSSIQWHKDHMNLAIAAFNF